MSGRHVGSQGTVSRLSGRTCQTSCRGSASGCQSSLAGGSGGTFSLGRPPSSAAMKIRPLAELKSWSVSPSPSGPVFEPESLKRACFLSAVTCVKRSAPISSWTFLPRRCATVNGGNVKRGIGFQPVGRKDRLEAYPTELGRDFPYPGPRATIHDTRTHQRFVKQPGQALCRMPGGVDSVWTWGELAKGPDPVTTLSAARIGVMRVGTGAPVLAFDGLEGGRVL